MSKPMLVTLPCVMLLLDYWPLGRLYPLSFRSLLRSEAAAWQASALLKLLIEKAPYLALAVLSSIVTLLVQQKAMLFYKNLPVPARAANALLSYVRYLEKALWPRELAVLYPHLGRWPVTLVIAAALLLLAISGVALASFRKRPYLAVGWFCFLGMPVPVLGLVQVGVQSMADRYTYLPLVGIFIMAVWASAEAMSWAKAPARIGVAVAAVLLAACAARTWSQVQLWRDTETLFTHAAAVTRGNWVAHYKLALVALQGYESAERKAVEDQLFKLQPTPPPRRAGGAEARDYLEEVISHCQTALRLEPRVVDVHVTLAKALTESGRLEEARAQLEAAIHIDPSNADAWENLAEILYRQGYAKEAVAEYRAALALSPDWEEVLNNLAWVLATHPEPEVRDGAEAVRLAERACRLSGHTNLWFQHTLAAAYAERGDFAKAIGAAERACQLAKASGRDELAKTAAVRLELYKAGRRPRAP